ncbi:MAG: hypothetical protein HOP11_13295 [Saprospiraceae bacterium]|nr:hypothetical protein [Saprospiraceae bacterium]
MRSIIVALWSIVVLTISCTNSVPSPIIAGKDSCTECKMGIIDTRYAGEVITNKGKIYKFDDIGCMLSFLQSKNQPENKYQKILISEYLNPKNWLEVKDAIFVQSNEIHSPMNFNFAAFADMTSLNTFFDTKEKQTYNWSQVKELIKL